MNSNETLLDLNNQILNYFGLSENLISCSFYLENGAPLTMRLFDNYKVLCKDVIQDKTNIFVIFANAEIDDQYYPKISHDVGDS